MLAGETIFFLPFVIARIFRPTLLNVFQIDNFQLGTAFSVYGIVASLSYFPSGLLADKFSSRGLLALALILTSILGVFYAGIPGGVGLKLIFGFWGLTTILLFWSALMKATREWSRVDSIGLSYGLLDGGRGLMAVLLGLIIVSLFEYWQQDCASNCTNEAFSKVLMFTVFFTALVGVLVWFGLRSSSESKNYSGENLKFSWSSTLVRPRVWIHGLIIMCAYSCYKVTDDFALYANEVLKLDEIASAKVGVISLWLRPIGAVVIGFLADKTKASTMIMLSFMLIIIGSISLSIHPSEHSIFILNLAISSVGIYALRGLYFAIMGEDKIPIHITGRIVGVVSVVGYLPDIFFSPIMGSILDNNPGAEGHFILFQLITAIAALGLFLTFIYKILPFR
jgi:sugar phosphate permease